MKITLQEYIAFIKKYYEEQPSNLRLGQYFCNTFNITDAPLFYSTDVEFVIAHIVGKYVDLEVYYDGLDTGIDDETGPFSRGA